MPNRPGSVFAGPAGTPLSSTWSTNLAMLYCHSNHIPSCTEGLIGQRVSPVAQSADSFFKVNWEKILAWDLFIVYMHCKA